MKKWMTAILAGLMMVGCQASPAPEKEPVVHHVLCPTGAPTLAFLSVYDQIKEEGEFTVTEGTDQLVAELSKTDSEYDIIVAPINLGGQLISKGKTEYRLDSVLTWGNLYLVGTEGALEGTGDIELFGEGAVPAKVYEASGIETSLTPKFVGEASMVSADLASGQASCGMLAEPVATATIAKAKQQNIELKVLVDLQEAYQKAQKSDEYGYPQAAIFVKEGTDVSDLTAEISKFTEDMSGAEGYLESIGTDTLGLPDKAVVVKSLERQNVHYRKAADVKEQVTGFLKLFGIDFTDDFLHD